MSNKLIPLLKYAEDNNSFYKEWFYNNDVTFLLNDEMWYENYKRLPVLNKSEIMKNYDKIISNDYNVEQLERQQTSGSTGEPLWIYKTESEINRQSSYIWKYRMNIANILPTDKFVRSYISKRKENNRHTSVLKEKNSIALNMLCITDEDLKNYYESIVDYKPKWLFLSPSFLYLITNYIENNKLTIPQVEYIELTGEYVPETLKKYFYALWNCKISIHYGCREVYAIATECRCNRLHIISENVFVDIENKDEYEDDFGEVVITSLNSKAMPLIKYSIGDIGRINNIECECGCKSPYIELIGGRKSEYIEINGKKVHSSLFHFVIKKINTNYNDAVLKFQVINKSGNLQLLLELKDENEFDKIAKEINSGISNFIQIDQCVVIKKMNFNASYIKENGKFSYIM